MSIGSREAQELEVAIDKLTGEAMAALERVRVGMHDFVREIDRPLPHRSVTELASLLENIHKKRKCLQRVR